MIDFYSSLKKYGLTLGLTPGFLWLIGGLLGVYFSKGGTMLFITAAITGGTPILFTFIAAKYNIFGAILLILEGLLLLMMIYFEGANLIIIVALFLSYSLPIILSGLMFISYWYKHKTRI